MTDSLVNVDVIVPYSRFLECQERRRGISAARTRPDHPPTINDDAVPAAVEMVSAQEAMANHVKH